MAPKTLGTASPQFRDFPSLIKHFEASGKVRTQAYKDSEGIPTIGWGATSYQDGRPVKMGDTVSPQQADSLLQFHADRSLTNLTKLPNWSKFSAEQQDALKSFAYNAGPNFLESPNFRTMADAIRKGDNQGISNAFGLYTNGGNAGLRARRDAERALFNTAPRVNKASEQGTYNPNSVGKQGPTFDPSKVSGTKKGKTSFDTTKMSPQYEDNAAAGNPVVKEKAPRNDLKISKGDVKEANTRSMIYGTKGIDISAKDLLIKQYGKKAFNQSVGKGSASNYGKGMPSVVQSNPARLPADFQSKSNSYGTRAFSLPSSVFSRINSVAWG